MGRRPAFRVLAAPAAALAALMAGLALTPGRAGAAQTSTWGIVPAPVHGQYRSDISDPADGSTVEDAVIVFNRTGAPITVDLQVVAAEHSGGVYQFSAPTSGLAAGVTLAAPRVTLAGHQQARVPVTIREPRGVRTTALAGIAAESAPVQDGDLSIVTRLVVLVEATPSPHLVPQVGPDLVPWEIAASSLILVIALLAAALWRQHRRARLRPAGSTGDG